MRFPEKIRRAISKRTPAARVVRRHGEFQELLLQLSLSFVNLPVDRIEISIDTALAKVAEFIESDRAYILAYDLGAGTASVAYQWHAPNTAPGTDLHPLLGGEIPEWLNPHVRGEVVWIRDLCVLMPGELRNLLEAQHVKSLIAVPLVGQEGCLGCVAFGTVRQHRDYDVEETRLLALFAQLLVNLFERKRTESDLRQSEARFRALFEQISNIAVQGYNRDRQVIFWNKASEKLYGYSAAEALGNQLEDLIIPEPMRGAVVEEVTCWVSGGRPTPAGEMTLRGKDGRPVPVYSSHVVVRSITGEPEMYCLDVDLAEQKKAAAELETYRLHLERLVEERTRELAVAKETAEAANLAKSKFLAASSHDLRQPLTAINLFLDALSRTAMSDDQRRFTGHLKHSVKSLGEMLNTLLDIARLDSGAIEAHFAPLRISELFRWVEADFSTTFNARHLRFKLYLPAGDVVVQTDLDLLKTMVRNILDNALKFCEQGGVLLGVRLRGDRVLLQIWDTGKGIAPEHIRNIFEEYYQVGNEERDPTKGVGLGLSIVLRQAQLIGAEVRCRSRVGRGSVFEIVLPRIAPVSEEKPEAVARGVERDLDLSRLVGRRVVVIEDNLQVGEAMAQSLRAQGMRVRVFGNGESAMADAEIADADLYISDVRLPGSMNGLQVLRAIEQRVRGPINAVLLTGEAAYEQMEPADSIPWKVLIKPVSLAELLATFVETLASPAVEEGQTV